MTDKADRQFVRNHLGSDVAKKASPELVWLLRRSLRGTRAPRRGGQRGGLIGLATSADFDAAFALAERAQRTPPSAGWRFLGSTRPPSIVVRLDRSNVGLTEPVTTATTRSQRVRALHARAKDFELGAREAILAAEQVDGAAPILGWSSGSLYLSPTLEALTALGSVDVVQSLEVGAQVAVSPADGSRSRRTSDVRLDNRVAGFDGHGVEVGIVDAQPGPHAWLPTLGATKDFTREGEVSPGAHATMVAGLIAANGPTYRGVAPGASLSGYKIVANNALLSTDEARVVDAVQTAALDGMDVINCSFSVSQPAHAVRLDEMMTELIAAGVVIVRSAGNTGARQFSLPCDATGLIIAGACTISGTAVADYSNGGASPNHPAFFLAPGGVPGQPLCGIDVNPPKLRNDCGTSYAAAIVSGLAACLRERDPGATPAQVSGHLAELRSGPLGAVLTL